MIVNSDNLKILTNSATVAGLDPLGRDASGNISLRGTLCRQIWERKAGYSRKLKFCYVGYLQ
jgi:hypothetical protein